MASFEVERALTQGLVAALALPPAEYIDPHDSGTAECGIDVVVRAGGLLFGVQVTTPDFGPQPGRDRAAEVKLKREAEASGSETYFLWTNGSPEVAYDAFIAAIERKATIAARHDFSGYDETWLLLACGVPTIGAVSTQLSPWIDTGELDQRTLSALQKIKYARVFIHSQLDVTPRLWMWTHYDRHWIEWSAGKTPW